MASEGVAAGLIWGKVPYVQGDCGPRKIVGFFGGKALLKRRDRPDARRYAATVTALFPDRITARTASWLTPSSAARSRRFLVPAKSRIFASCSQWSFLPRRIWHAARFDRPLTR